MIQASWYQKIAIRQMGHSDSQRKSLYFLEFIFRILIVGV